MTEQPSARMKVECTECNFSEVLPRSEDGLPADVVVEHGRETGHTLRVSPHAG